MRRWSAELAESIEALARVGEISTTEDRRTQRIDSTQRREAAAKG
jgi:hypothetical protein